MIRRRLGLARPVPALSRNFLCPNQRSHSSSTFPVVFAEVIDNGYPQIVAADALKLYITQQGVKSELDGAELAASRPRPKSDLERACKLHRVLRSH